MFVLTFLQEQRPPAMCFDISLNSGSIVSSHPCSLLFPPHPAPASGSHIPVFRLCSTYVCLIGCNSVCSSEEGNKKEACFLKCSACSWDYLSIEASVMCRGEGKEIKQQEHLAHEFRDSSLGQGSTGQSALPLPLPLQFLSFLVKNQHLLEVFPSP